MSETPAFARDFPPEASDAVSAFAKGDFGATQQLIAPWLSSPDPALRKAAIELRNRMRPPRLAILLLALSAVLLVGLSGYWIYKRGPGATTQLRP